MSNIRGVSILGGTVTATLSGTSTVSVSGFESDAITQLKNIRADEIQERNAQNHFRTYDPILEKLVLELVGEIKQIRHQLEIITGEEIGDIER